MYDDYLRIYLKSVYSHVPYYVLAYLSMMTELVKAEKT